MKSIGKIIKKITGCGSIAVATFYLTALGLNHLFSNKEHIDWDYHSVSKAEGAFGHTEYTHRYSTYYKYDTVSQRKGFFSPLKFITDGQPFGKNDGLVDRINCSNLGILHRKKDYEKFKEEFDEADKLLAETKERFKDLF